MATLLSVGKTTEGALAIGLLVTALLACGGWSPSWRWEPRSSTTNDSQITSAAMRVYRDDLRWIEKAGGVPLGTLDVTAGRRAQDAEEWAPKQVAELGGTHFVPGRLTTTTETTGYAGTGGKNWFYVTPISETSEHWTFIVYRVPKGSWERLPPTFRPPPRD